MNSLTKNLITINDYCDFIPVISGIVNVITIVEKIALDILSLFLQLPKDNFYIEYLNKKSYTRCFLLLFPFVNIISKIYFIYTDTMNLCTVKNIDWYYNLKKNKERFQLEKGQLTAFILNLKEFNCFDGAFTISVALSVREITKEFLNAIDCVSNLEEDFSKEFHSFGNLLEKYYVSILERENHRGKINALNFWGLSCLLSPSKYSTSEYIDVITNLKKGECYIEHGGAKEHAVSWAIYCVEPKSTSSEGIYHILVGNAGAGIDDFHLRIPDTSLVLPFILFNLTLEQATEKVFVEELCRNNSNKESYYGIYNSLIFKEMSLYNKFDLVGTSCFHSTNFTDRVDCEELRKYAYPQQNMGNCSYKSFEALIFTLLKMNNVNTERISFRLLLSSWIKDFNFTRPEVEEKEGVLQQLFDETLLEIKTKLNELAKCEKCSIEDIAKKYCTKDEYEQLSKLGVFIDTL